MNAIARNIFAGSVVALALGISSNAVATPIATVDVTFPNGSGLFPNGQVTTTITYNNGMDGPRNWRVAAGMFGGSASNGVNFDETTLYRSSDDLLAYCVDILNSLLRNTSTYTVNALAQDQVVTNGNVRRDFGRTFEFLGAVNYVAQRDHALAFGSENWLNPAGGWMSGAIQVGIWESLYEKEGAALSTSGGWFSATSLGEKGNRFLNSAFIAMDSSPALDAGRVKWLEIANGQDLLVDPVSVPAPGSLLMVAAGLVVLRLGGASRTSPRKLFSN